MSQLVTRAPVCNPSYSGDRDKRRIVVCEQPRQKVNETQFQQNKLGVAVCLSSQLGGKHRYEDHCLKPAWAKSKTLSEEQPKAKRTGDMAQVVDHLIASTRL
jgi:hypothetical protein